VKIKSVVYYFDGDNNADYSEDTFVAILLACAFRLGNERKGTQTKRNDKLRTSWEA